MRISKRQIVYFSIVVIIAVFLSSFQLPYYIYKPGRADSLEPIVAVDGGYESEGSMHLLTVSGSQATPIQYLFAKFQPYYEVLPLKEVRQGLSDDEYLQRQLHMMENSQESSMVVAYESADADVDIEYRGVYVMSVIEEMPAEGILEMGDIITSIDGINIQESDDLIAYVETKEAGETITLEIERDETKLTKEIQLQEFEDEDGKIGVGITLVTNRYVEVEPEVHFSSGKIGGPSAGLVFALDIYDQLIEMDLTKGYHIAATGEIDYEGNVGPIGGVDKKVVAADREGCDIFFAPNEGGAEDSNYAMAKETAEKIKTNMKVIPVDTFEDAVTYLENLEEKQD